MKSFFDLSDVANKIGIQLYRVAKQKAYEVGQPDNVDKFAEQMANKFHSNILAAIDAEIKFQAAKEVK